jgi:two-component system response regulator HydG
MGFIVSAAKTSLEARELLAGRHVNIVLVRGVDDRNDFANGVRRLHPDTGFIFLQDGSTEPSHLRDMWLDIVPWPVNPRLLAASLERMRQQVRLSIGEQDPRGGLANLHESSILSGNSLPMQMLRKAIVTIASSSNALLITGESGSAADLIALSIHSHSVRAKEPFVKIACKNLSPALRGSELFGHERSAFRSAQSNVRGLLIGAENGTVLLEEITDLPYELQAQLAHAIRQRRVTPFGSARARPLLARLIATTSRDLSSLARQGRFHSGLLEVVNLSRIIVAPLRERPEDIEEIARNLLEHVNRRAMKNCTLDAEVLSAMREHSWPGDLREMEELVVSACRRSSREILTMRDFPSLRIQSRGKVDRNPYQTSPAYFATETDLSMSTVERQAIQAALNYTSGDKTKAAKRLGIGKTTLYRKLKEYKLA